jgi:hypothetical protein
MAWAHVADQSGYRYDSGSTLDAAGTLHLEVGDVLCIYTGWMGATTTVAVATTAPADSFTMQTVNQYGTRNGGCIGHVVVGTHNASATIRVTLGAARAAMAFTVMQFRPDAGDEISLVAGPASASNGGSNTPQTANMSPSGTDLLLFAGAYNAAGMGYGTSHQIGDVNDDGALDSNRCTGFYRLVTSDQTNIHGQCTYGDVDSWTADMIALESAAAAGGGYPMYAYAQQ